MKICGIVTEYNPFHNGHRYHIEKSRKVTNCDCLIAVMSGNFVQRGEPAIIDKWQRAACAISQGVDLVLELPYIYATQSADAFALGAISTLALAGCDSMVFGSECNDITSLQELRQATTNLTVRKDRSFVKNFADHTQCVSSNDILGISYLKALEATSIVPYTIQRTNSYHELDHEKEVASASAIRHAVLQGKDVQHASIMAASLDDRFAFDRYYPYLQTYLMTANAQDLADIFLMEEGMEQLFIRQAAQCEDMTSFVNACTSARYTRSRIQRTIVQVLTQTKKHHAQALDKLAYIRVLAFNDTGRQHLSTLREQVLVASVFHQIPEAWRTLELKATQAYAYPLPPSQRKAFVKQEWQPPRYVK